MKNFEFSKYCTPAQLYLVLGAIGIIMGFFKNYSIETLLTKALFLVVWAWVLNWLCSKGFKAISWILVLLPFIMILSTYFLIKDVAVKEGANFASVGAGAAKPIGGNPGIMKPSTPAPTSIVSQAAAAAEARAAALAAAQAARATCISGCKSDRDTRGCERRCPK